MSSLVFPALPGLDWGAVKRPIWRTHIQSAVSGKELRTQFMSSPLWQFELKFSMLRSAAGYLELQKLMGFYLQVGGSYDTWLFTDPTDYSATTMSFGTGNGVSTQFQLTRVVGAGGFTFVETVQNLNGSPSIYVNGVLQTITTNYTINPLGVVTFVVPPGNGLALTWTGSFYYRCRFMEDTIDLVNFMSDLWELETLEFQSVKL